MDCPWPQGYTAKPANVEPCWFGSLKTLSTLSDSVRERERERVVYAARVLWGKPWQTSVTPSGLAKRAALHSPHHTICSKWKGYNGSSDRKGDRGSKTDPFFSNGERWILFCCEITTLIFCYLSSRNSHCLAFCWNNNQKKM